MTLRGLVERTRQRFQWGDKAFKPTPNVRNPAMLLEAEAFAKHMESFRHIATRYERTLSAVLASVPDACATNLPRVWEAVDGTSMCEPTRTEVSSAHPFRTGGDYDEVLMADTAEIMRARLDTSIIKPLDRWLASLQVVKKRMAHLEQLRVEVDARRRRAHRRWLKALGHISAGQATAIRTQAQVSERRELATSRGAAQRHAQWERQAGAGEEGGGTSAQTAGGVWGEGTGVQQPPTAAFGSINTDEDVAADLSRQRDREDYSLEAMNQQRQLEAVAESYKEQEELVFEQLGGLVRDAAYFKSYVAATLLIIKDALQGMLVALGPCKRPLPGFSDREPADASATYGRTAPIIDLVRSLPPVVREGGRQLPPGLRAPGAVPPEQIRPTRMTAQPLQVAADTSDPEARFQPVPPVVQPASAVPAELVAASGLDTGLAGYGGFEGCEGVAAARAAGGEGGIAAAPAGASEGATGVAGLGFGGGGGFESGRGGAAAAFEEEEGRAGGALGGGMPGRTATSASSGLGSGSRHWFATPTASGGQGSGAYAASAATH